MWGRSRCTYKDDKFNEHGGYPDLHHHYQFIKKLKKVKDKDHTTYERMLIVDDTPEKIQNSYGNAIYIAEFTGRDDDRELEYLLHYLHSIKDVPDVRLLEKRWWRQHRKE